MKVLQIHNKYAFAGGEDTIADTEADLLVRAGHEVERVRVRNIDRGAAALRAYAAAPYNIAQYRDMRARARAFGPDIAHVHNTWFTLTPSVFHALRAESVPIVMTLQNFRLICAEGKLYRNGRQCTECVSHHPWRAMRYSCYRDSIPSSAVAAATISLNRGFGSWDLIDRFFAPSEFVKDVFVRGGFDARRIVVKPNVVPDPGPRPRPPSDSRTLLYVGRLAREKGPDVLLEAWRHAAPAVPDLELVMIGDGPMRAELESRAPERVRLLGWVEPDQLHLHMLNARALIFPTQCSENFGRSIVEAMAAGMPVLASDIATPADLVGELGQHWLVAPHDPPAWAAALAALDDDATIDAGGRRGRGLFERKYTFEIGLRRLMDVYETIRDVTSTSTGRG
ncbi:MAG: glycosyltransferase family 4 protein [Solirubrobacteraceae bacterium]